MQEKSRIHHSFTIFYKNEFEIDFLIEEIFNQGCYHFIADNDSPLIIDCGSHIGCSVLYFKWLYPNARIVAFEPDIQSFELLKKNVVFNRLSDVSLFNIALSDFQGTALMHGDFSETSESVGNTIIKEWGDREGFSTKAVPVDRLSTYLNGTCIDYLKIDTEGTELAILEDISASLGLVKNIFVEFHEFEGNGFQLEQINEVLLCKDFKSAAHHLELGQILAGKYPKWSVQQKPVVHIIKGKNKIYEIRVVAC